MSSKEWALGTLGRGVAGEGSSKDWATRTGATVDNAEYSAKEYASGTTVTTGSSKEWSTNAGSAEVASGQGYSAKAYAQDTGNNIGSSRDWATLATQVASTDYSAKTFAQSAVSGTDTYGGSAKGWSSTAHATQVPGGSSSARSALHYSTEASNSAIAAKASANAVSNTFDKFDDTYLGSMTDAKPFTAQTNDVITANGHGLVANQQIHFIGSDLPAGLSASTDYYARDITTNTLKVSASSGGSAVDITDTGSGTNTWVYATFGLTGCSWTKDSSTITVPSNVGVRVGQIVSGTGIPTSPKPNVLSISGTSVVISENMSAAGSNVSVTFANLGVNGTFDTTKDGPSTNNDGDALITGSLYFNNTDNSMKVYDGANWIAATSAGTTSILEYKFVTTSGQVSSRTYSGSADEGGTLSYTSLNTLVFLNGVLLKETVGGNTYDYIASNGTSVILTVAPALNDELTVVAFKSFTVADTVSSASGGTFGGNVTFNGNVISATDKKVQQKGAFMQSSTHQALILGV